MSNKPLDISAEFARDAHADYISNTWVLYNSLRYDKIKLWNELRNYIFATDTTSTTNKSLPWKNSTTLPKLCQIRDNLHSNYLSALFPNDEWLKWEAYSVKDASKEKTKTIEAYISNKCRQANFRGTISDLLYDYIDKGMCFVTADYESSYREDSKGAKVPVFLGPKAKRISPLDIVFNPLANSFDESIKIVRSLKTIGELFTMAEDNPDNEYLRKALKNRKKLINRMNGYGLDDVDKAQGFLVDGFGSYSEYLKSGYVEFLEFYGDVFDIKSGKLEKGQVITVIDRMWTIRKEPFPTWLGTAPIYCVGWRKRTDNLWAMGPLENLVGLQYRLDHLENLKADAMDMAVLPPLVIKGEVEQFTYAPGCEIQIDENGGVEELGKNLSGVIAADNQIDKIEMRMEQYAGAPKEAMGVRSAGEKTAFEVEQLQNAAGRIFQEKITTFEIELLEKLLNLMLEVSVRNLDSTDVVRVLDDDLAVVQFREITKDDITASGVLRPIGARHFASQAKLVQNLTGIFNSPMAQVIAPHVSSKNLAKMLEDVLNIGRYSLFAPHSAIIEGKDTARLQNQAQEDLETEQAVGTNLQ
jgi:hypothetical protein